MMLALFMTTSCSIMNDNPVTPPTPEKTTTTITLDGVDYEADVVATFKGEIGQEVSLTLGVYDDFDIYGVDFGDGNILTDTVCYQNGGLRDAEGITRTDTKHTKATVFTGTVAGEGNITVYGVNKSDIWYLVCSGNAIPTSFDQEKLKNVVQASFSGANVESIELPALECLTQFSFTNSPVKSVDVSKATKLESLSIVYAPTYTGEMNLEAIDVQNNTELTYLSIQAQATGVNAKLKEIDLSKNTKLTSIYLPNNSLEKVTLPADYTSTDPNNPSALAKVTVFLQNNQLTAVDGDLDKLPAKSQINISNNKFMLGTLPVKPANVTASKYTYAPQPAYQVNAAYTENDVLDLSSQLTTTGVASEPKTTTYTLKAGATTLTEGEDYQVVEPGKFKFLKSQAEPVHVEMATEAFPKFKNANAYVTTDFTVTITAEN